MLMAVCAGLLLFGGCKSKDKVMEENPFIAGFNTPYGIPDFGKIKTEHYMPAFEEGMRQQKAEIDEIVNNTEAPTFENTIEAYEYSGELLGRVSSVFFNLSECENNEEMEAIADKITPMLSAHGDDIALNAKLFARIKAVYDQKESLNLDPEQMKLLEETYKGFVRSGANVPAEQQERFRQLNEQIASLTLRFAQNVLKATNAYKLVLTADQLEGLTEGQIAAAKEAAEADPETKGKYVITLHMPSMEPFLQNCPNRELRKELWDAYSSRCNGDKFDNTKIIDTLVNLRLERANILGFKSHADYVLDDCLAKTPEAVYACLMQIWNPALKKAKAECAEYQKMIAKDIEGAKLEPWDWRYYSEKLRKEKYDLDDEVVRPYFSLDNVLGGAFMVANKLYNIEFAETDTLPTYDKEARVFEVKDGGKVIGILYMDFFPRESKRSGAWMTEFRGQRINRQGENEIPIIQVVCNFTKPTVDKPSLLNFDESETLFHEFGHALHGLLSKCHYPSLAGTSVPRDFVELPSQIMENWAYEPEYLKTFAKHYKTGEVIPQDYLDRIVAAKNFLAGYACIRQLNYGTVDMEWHSLKSIPEDLDVVAFEQEIVNRAPIMPSVEGVVFSPSFSHIFAGGYSAGYYSYKWAEVLEADAFSLFKERGIFDRGVAGEFRSKLLSKGGTVDAAELFRDFRGRDPQPDALLEKMGMK